MSGQNSAALPSQTPAQHNLMIANRIPTPSAKSDEYSYESDEMDEELVRKDSKPSTLMLIV